jgi:hypothetical protein
LFADVWWRTLNMAATTFKQPCPSCEAQVPIKDPKLIGRKIDCPKCKYRFVVEEPEDDAPEVEAVGARKTGKTDAAVTARRPVNGRGAMAKSGGKRGAILDDEDGDQPAKKKGGGLSTTLILGIGLGAVALVLVVVGILAATGVFSGSKPTNQSTSNSGNRNSGGGGDEKKEPDPTPTLQLSDPTNYLPNDSDDAVCWRWDKVIDSPLGRAAFRTPGSFSLEAFQKKFGFPLENVTQIVSASNQTLDWIFNVIRTSKPVKEADLVNLNLKKADKKVGEFDYFLIQADLDSTSTRLLSDRKPRQFALHILDAQTLIVASEQPLVKFLEDNRQPQRLSEPPTKVEPDQDPDKAPDGKDGGAKPPGGGAPFSPGAGMAGAAGGPSPPGAGKAGAAGGSSPPGAGMAGAAGGPGGPMRPGVGIGGGGPMPPGGAGGFPGGPGGGAKPPPSASPSYLTINPALKSMLDKLTQPEKEPALMVAAASTKVGEGLLRDQNVNLPGMDISQFTVEHLRDVQVVGVCLKTFSISNVTLLLGLDCKTDQVSKNLEFTLQKQLPVIAIVASDLLEIPITAGNSNAQTGPGRPPFGGGPFPPGGGMGRGSGAYGGGQFPPGGGSGAPFPPGGGGGAPFPPGSGGPFPPGGGGPFPPGGGGRPGMPDDGVPGRSGEDTSYLNVSRVENTILLSANVIWNHTAFDRVFPYLQDEILHLKGQADMVGGKSHIHDLAFAVHSYAQEKGQFPRGTAERRSTTDRAGLPFRPDQRVSWMADLLPYLGQGEFRGLKNHIDDQQSWRDLPGKDKEKENKDAKNNRFVAQTLIPYFLSNKNPEASWWVNYPGLDHKVASTHFVGIAGIGLDAASYSATDPAVAKKLGVFGYDRATKLEDIKDGLDKTIVMLQIPTDVKSCWLAGGGSTIRGVPENDPIQPFVCGAEYTGPNEAFKGKQGTFAIMGDGKVRFISKDMNPEIFKGMCTINGGERIGDLDEIAPEVPGGEAVLKPQLPPGVKPPVDNPPKPPAEGTPKAPDGG